MRWVILDPQDITCEREPQNNGWQSELILISTWIGRKLILNSPPRSAADIEKEAVE